MFGVNPNPGLASAGSVWYTRQTMLTKQTRDRTQMWQRNLGIKSDYASGLYTYREISDKWGLSYQRVHQIVNDIRKRAGGASPNEEYVIRKKSGRDAELWACGMFSKSGYECVHTGDDSYFDLLVANKYRVEVKMRTAPDQRRNGTSWKWETHYALDKTKSYDLAVLIMGDRKEALVLPCGLITTQSMSYTHPEDRKIGQSWKDAFLNAWDLLE